MWDDWEGWFGEREVDIGSDDQVRRDGEVGGIGRGDGVGVKRTDGCLSQICRTRAESQRIVAARPLCRLQYPVRAKSSAKDLPQ